ncbi:MAG: hemerythrin domain-containing protein [Acidobacteria bacterium]|nr:hemerythrin domain-containing protein [Acidobacteriota bacterium]
MLKEDHKKVKGLFKEYRDAGPTAHKTKEGIAQKAMHELMVHSQIEEEIFYPAAKAASGKESKHMVAEAVEEHHVVDVLMEEIKTLDPQDERFDAKFIVLMENVEHHIEEEEDELFPEVEDAIADKSKLDQIGEKMHRRKEELMKVAV